MKLLGRRIRKRFLSMFLAVLMVFGSVTLLPAQQANAGIMSGIAGWAMGQAKDIMVSAVFKGLSELIGDDTVYAKALQDVLSLAKSSQSRALGKFEAEMMAKCNEILEQLDELDAAVADVSRQNQEIVLQLDQANLNTMANEMNTISGHYSLIVEAYRDLIAAEEEYVKNPSDETYNNLVNELKPIQEFYETANTNTGDIQYNFTKDITDYVSYISPYQYSTHLQEKTEWVKRSFGLGETTYIQAIEKYYNDSTASQAETYTALSAALNYSVIPLYYYLMDRQLYTTMKVNEINLDTTLTQAEKKQQMSAAWADYESDKNIAQNALNQMISDNYDTLTSYMRPYDLEPTRVTMDYAKTRHLEVDRDLANGKREYDVTASDKTAEELGFSILKLRDGTVYAILSDRGENPDFVLNDFASVVAKNNFYRTTNTFASGDYYNLQSGSGGWSALKLVRRASDFKELTSSPSYALANNNLANYIVSTEGISGVFSDGLNKDPYYGLTSSNYDNFYNDGMFSQDMTVVFYNAANMSNSGLDSSEINVDLEDKIHDNSGWASQQPVAVVMKKQADQDITLNMHIPAIKDCDVKLEYVDKLDENGNQLEITGDADGNYQVIAGERIQIKVKPATGKKIASAVLSGEMMDGSWSDLETFVDPNESGYVLNSREEDAYGYISLQTFPMPYRNAEVNISTENQQNEITYSATLQQPQTSGQLQFYGMPGVDNVTYHSGDTVRVVVWPEGRFMANGLIVTDATGNELKDVVVTDETASSITEYPDGVKVYCFTMPTQDVKISADISAEFVATLGDVDDGKLVFTDSAGNEIENAGQTKVYASGERVYVKGVPRDSASYFCESITVKYDGGTGQAVPVRIEEDGISFIMPEMDVRVVGDFKKRSNYDVFSSIQSKNNATGMLQLNGNNSMQGNYAAGETVTVTVTPGEGSWMDSYSITRTMNDGTEGKTIESTCVHREDSMAWDITFTMPAQNVDVSVTFDQDTSELYTGTLQVGYGVRGTVVEKKGQQQNELLSNITDGSDTFVARSMYSYELTVEKLEGQEDPTVTLTNKDQSPVTLTATQKEGNLYTYTWDNGLMTDDFTVSVENGTDLREWYDYIIWDYQDMTDCWADLNRMYNVYHIVPESRVLFAADITVPEDGNFVMPVPEFAGLIDGAGHTINGLHVAQWNLSYGQGLIARLNANGQIKNLKVSGVYDITANQAGVFAGYMAAGSVIDNCMLSGTVNDTSAEFGGIAHTLEAGAIIRNCGVDADIQYQGTGADEASAGGIAYSNQGRIENSYFTGAIQILNGTVRTIAGICAGGDQDKGVVWNCYTGDNFADLSLLADSGKNYVYDIANKNQLSMVYVPKETKDTLAQTGQITYTAQADVDYSKSVSDMTSQSFADLLNKNAGGNEIYETWLQSTALNGGYPCFEWKASQLYAITVKDESESADITGFDGACQYIDQVTYGLAHTFITVSGKSTGTDPVNVEVREKDTGKLIMKTACDVGSSKYFQTEFWMPETDVEVTLTDSETHYGKIPVSAIAYPSSKADVTLFDENGDYMVEADSEDMIYVHVDNIAEGYEVSRLIFKNSLKTQPYKIIDNPNEVKQKDGSYGVILSGDPSLVRGKATIIVEIKTKSHTIENTVTPENAGSVQYKSETARYGDTVSFTATPANGYYVSGVKICNTKGDVLAVPELTQKTQGSADGSFVMPDEDVVIHAEFAPFVYAIRTKDSENVTLSVTDAEGNYITNAQRGAQVTVHYSKKPWTAYEQISVYKVNDYQTENAQPIATWTARLPKDTQENPLTFEMPASGVIIESVMLDSDGYAISKEVEGQGNVYVKDLKTGSVDSANEGEKIFVTASAQRGWSLDRDQTAVYDAQDHRVDVNAQDHGRYVSFAMPAQDLKIKAVFTQDEYTVTVKEPSEGTILVTDADGNAIDLNAVHYGDDLKIKVTGSSIKSVHYSQTDVENGAMINLPLDENGEATLSMPDMNITIEEGSVMERDEEGNYLIRTFDDLASVAKIVQVDNRANFKVMNTISGEGQTLTQTIGSETNPYEGTFDGQGYDIFNFAISNDGSDAALFGTIGSKGTVKRLSVFYDHVDGERAAGITVVNNGLIDDCISGANLSGSITLKNQTKPVDLATINTFVTGVDMAGGIAVENHGKILNTSSYAQCIATASDGVAGGIAAVNDGTIENSFCRGVVAVGSTAEEAVEDTVDAMLADTDDTLMAVSLQNNAATSVAGGIVGQNTANGIIHNVYSAADTVSASTAGAIFGQNDGGTISHAYFDDELPGDETQGTAMSRTSMEDSTFVDTLNREVSENSGLNRWYVQANRNKGLPRLYSSATMQMQVQNLERGITVTGRIHADAGLQVDKLDTESDIYRAFAEYAAGNNRKMVFAGNVQLLFSDGQLAPYQGSLNAQIDLSKYSGRNFKVLVYRDGTVQELTINDQNLAALDTDQLLPFAVIAEMVDDSGNNNGDNTGTAGGNPSDGAGIADNGSGAASDLNGNGSTGISDAAGNGAKTPYGSNGNAKLTSTKTGDSSHIALWSGILAAAVCGAGICIGCKCKKKRKENM